MGVEKMRVDESRNRAVNAKEAQELRLIYSDPVPIGDKVVATLNGKSWGKATNLICYFIDEKTGAKFTISVFRSNTGNNIYCADDHKIDFSEPNIEGQIYNLNIQKSPRAKFPKLKEATRITS